MKKITFEKQKELKVENEEDLKNALNNHPHVFARDAWGWGFLTYESGQFSICFKCWNTQGESLILNKQIRTFEELKCKDLFCLEESDFDDLILESPQKAKKGYLESF